MAKAVFTTSENSAYDDQPEWRYHFPRTYLAQAKVAVGDWVLYYEPRRNHGPSSSSGRQAYFAMAQLERVEPDAALAGHYYAYVREYIEFDRAVPFRDGGRYYESSLMKPDGSTNKGAFGRSVRGISEEEFAQIVAVGFAGTLSAWDFDEQATDPVPESVDRPSVTQILQRKYRDAAFRRHVRVAYDNTCRVASRNFVTGCLIKDVTRSPLVMR
jgi:putative restriction endonuclease